MSRATSWRTSVIAAVVGSGLAALVDYLIRRSSGQSDIDVANIIVAAIVGSILGWFFELARGMQELLNETYHNLDTLSRTLKHYDKALDMLNKHKRHKRILDELITSSVRDRFKEIPNVNLNNYLYFLQLAIAESKHFQGIQDKTPRYYTKTERGGEYLQKVKQRNIPVKRRIFYIKDADIPSMEEDIQNTHIMAYYWDNTGHDVQTYWISESKYRRYVSSDAYTPADCGLYDNELLIVYDAQRDVVRFDILEDGSIEKRIFELLEEQIRLKMHEPFTQIKP